MQEKSQKKLNVRLAAFATILSIAIFVLILWFFLQGKMTTSGHYPDDIKNQSLACQAHNVEYPVFGDNHSVDSAITINAIFSDEHLQSISLMKSLFYNDENAASIDAALQHAAMNISFGKDNLEADAFSASYNSKGNELQMTLFTQSNTLTNTNSKYFMIKDFQLTSTINDYKIYYEKNGFTCEISK